MYIHKSGNGRRKDRPYTHFEIAKMLEKADQRGKISILLMCSAGLRIGALPYIKLRNLERIEKYNLYKITVYEGEEEEYITFCTPECASAIDSYLEYRQRHGERPLKEDSPLIREEFDINDEIMATNPKTLGMEAFRRMVKRVGFDSGVMERHAALVVETSAATKRGQRLVKETHGFRKFFQTTTVSNGMSVLYSEMLMGHKSGGLALESYVSLPKTTF
jgi:site-specific recombinase XerD